MMFVYSRVGGGAAADGADGAWLRGAGARSVPYRRDWVANAGRAGGIWREMAFAAPAPQRQRALREGQDAYILQQDPGGLWFVDPWASNGAGAIRPAPSRTAVPRPPNSRDLDGTCFIIELERATHP